VVEEENRQRFETIEVERREKSERAAQIVRDTEAQRHRGIEATKQAYFGEAERIQTTEDHAMTNRVQRERGRRDEETRVREENKQIISQ
jgi:hypothetical protein